MDKSTKSQKRLLKLFEEIDDESIREIMSTSIMIEARNRSSKNFPLREIRDIIDREANLIEIKGDENVI